MTLYQIHLPRKFVYQKQGHPSVTVAFDKIHIFNGKENTKHYYTIYDVANNTIEEFEDESKTYSSRNVSVLKYKNRFIQIGGWSDSKLKYLDTVLISEEITKDHVGCPKWMEKPEWRLPRALACCGHILYRDWVIIFGGVSTAFEYLDRIYLLDLSGDNGWQELTHLRCPMTSRYLAVMCDGDVHLFAGYNKDGSWLDSEKGHYVISIQDLMGDYYPFRFDLGVLKGVDSKIKDVVYGYFRSEQSGIQQIIPNDVIDVCLVYYFM